MFEFAFFGYFKYGEESMKKIVFIVLATSIFQGGAVFGMKGAPLEESESSSSSSKVASETSSNSDGWNTDWEEDSDRKIIYYRGQEIALSDTS